MSYFNHAFNKVFVGTHATQAAVLNTSLPVDQGFLTASGVPTITLNDSAAPNTLGTGTFGFFNPETWTSVNAGDLTALKCCPLVLASAALVANDKVGPFHGGYTETNKSKLINPKYVTRFYRVDACTPQQAVMHIGTTNFTGVGQIATFTLTTPGSGYPNGTYTVQSTSVSPANGVGATFQITVVGGAVQSPVILVAPGLNYEVGDVVELEGGTTNATVTINTIEPNNVACDFTFFCGETYYLRIDIKGSPALRFANHMLYRTLQADGGCCPTMGTPPVQVPGPIDSTLIFIQWADGIINDPFFAQFVQPIVFDQAGNPWYAPGTPGVNTWDNYVSPGYVTGATGGIRLAGAYVDTKFGNCTFQISDHYEREPIQLFASLVDYLGDPCEFEGICVITECSGLQGNGFGEQVVRDVLLSEEYRQQHFHSDLRIREVTQGDQVLASINRNALYTRYYIQHVVPRFNNPSSTFDNDQYLLEVITNGPSASFETFVNTWLDNCSQCPQLEVYTCDPCDIVPVGVVPVAP